MKALVVMSAALLAIVVFAGADVRAAPIAASASADSNVVLVVQGCGRGFHRGPRGVCRRNTTRNYPCFWVRGAYGRWRLVCR